MTDIRALTNRIHRTVKGSRREQQNELSAAINASVETISMKKPLGNAVAEGTYVGVNSELMYVWATSGLDATVERGSLGTTAASHLEDDLIEINWRFFTADVVDTVADEILSWPRSIYQVATQEVSLGDDGVTGIDVTLTGFMRMLEARQTIAGSTAKRMPVLDVDYVQNLPTAEYSTGNALFVRSGWGGPATINCVYAKAFTLTDIRTLATTYAAIGLSDTLLDAAIYGTAWRLLQQDASQRSQMASQPEPRDSEEVGAIDAARTASLFKEIRDDRLNEEATRLADLYPPRFRTM